MAHCVEALIARIDTLASGLASLRHARVVPLDRGLALAPVTDELFDEISDGTTGTGEPPFPEFWKLSADLASLAIRLSASAPVAYVETDYFGGIGTQAAIVWDRGRIVVGPFRTGDGAAWIDGAINRALRYFRVASPPARAIGRFVRFLGISARLPGDEFDAVGLGRFRSNEDWIDPRRPGRPAK